MRLIVLLSLTIFSITAKATVTIENLDCPTQFEGKVKEIVQELGPSNPLSTQKVIFETVASIKGDVQETVSLDLLKYGPFEIETGEIYQVQTKDGKLCWIEKI